MPAAEDKTIITNAGIAVFRGRVEANSALFAGNFYMALSSDTSALAAGDTSIPSEITGSGLSRAVCTFAHTTGANTWTAANTFTYTGSTTVNVNKIGIFDASSGGNLIAEYLLGTSTTFNNSGDNAQFSCILTI